MKARITPFSIKDKADIWWEYMKNVKDIQEDDLTWHAFERLFKKKYLSESILLGMDWLYLHITKVDCFDKAIKYVDDSGEKRTLQGKKKPTPVRMVTAMWAKHSYRKGCVMFVVHISSDKGKEVEDAEVLSRYLVLQYFQDVSHEDITEFLPYKEVEFSSDLVPGAAPTSEEPYRMSTPELLELKLQLKELLEKGYIRPSV
eukprot:PITA_35113